MNRFDFLESDADAGAPEPSPRPSDGPGCYKVARRLRQAGHFATATMYYERAVGLDEHHRDAWVELVDTLVRSGQIERAGSRSEYVLSGYGQVRVYYASRALALAHLGQYKEAKRLSDISFSEEEPLWYARSVRAEILLRQDPNFRDSAMQFVEEALAIAARDRYWDVNFLAGLAFTYAELHTYAAAFFAEAAHAVPTSFVAWLNLGDAFQELRLYDQALFYYQRAAQLDPANEEIKRRQQETRPKTYGLLRVFMPVDLVDRWNKLSEPD